MANVVIMPKAGQSMEEGKIVSWLKKAGDTIAKGDVLLEVETDKATLEVESQFAGVLEEVLANDGDVVPVLVPVAIIAKKGEKYDRAALLGGSAAPAAAPKSAEPVKSEAPKPAPAAAPAVASTAVTPAAATLKSAGRVFASPAARRVAREKGIDLTRLSGTGPNGRIRQTDVAAFLATPGGAAAAQAAPPVVSGEAIPFSRMRLAIAKALQSSKVNAPHFYVTMDIDMTAAWSHRSKVNAALVDGQSKVSFNDMVIRACALALEAMPQVNCHTDGVSVTYKTDINIGMAVSVSEGLVVPVLLNANRRSLSETANATKQLALNAQQGRIIGTGQGTFTISNMGMLGVKSFSAIINPPEAAILAVGSIADRVVAINNAIAIRKVMEVTLSADHRVVDGALAAQFVGKVKGLLEAPEGL